MGGGNSSMQRNADGVDDDDLDNLDVVHSILTVPDEVKPRGEVDQLKYLAVLANTPRYKYLFLQLKLAMI